MTVFDANKIKIERLPVVTGLPRNMYADHFGLLPDGKPFVIARPSEDWSYTDFCCVIDGQSVRVDEVVRYRDGGTTKVKTQAGDFYFPTPFDREKKATFNGHEITVYERLF